MIPHQNRSNSDHLIEDIKRLWRQGFSLLPLAGDNGKIPQCNFAGTGKIPLSQILAIMKAKGSNTYGIRLPDMVVVDCDESSPELIQDMQNRFGDSPIQVKTPRGMHLYYRNVGNPMPNLRAECLPVDIKTGTNSFVVGPCSIRPTGEVYVALSGCLGETELPDFTDTHKPLQSVSAQLVKTGRRHNVILAHGMKLLTRVSSMNELIRLLLAFRDKECCNPSTAPDSEVREIADWCWKQRLNNSVYNAQISAFTLWRNDFGALNGNVDAIALFTVLQQYHGHRLGKTFPLINESMKSADLIKLSRDRFIAAREYLIKAGLLEIAAKHRAGMRHRHYRLLRLNDYHDP